MSGEDQHDELRRHFEERYAATRETGDTAHVPWARSRPNPLLVEWLAQAAAQDGARALVVGCGLGDDAEALAAAGYRVTAIDIAPSAVALCRERFPGSPVDYRVADLLDPPAELLDAFQLVFEAYTLQALPAELRPDAMRRLAGFLAPAGLLLVVTRARRPGQIDTGHGPQGLTREDLAGFAAAGLTEERVDEVPQGEGRPWDQYRVAYRRG